MSRKNVFVAFMVIGIVAWTAYSIWSYFAKTDIPIEPQNKVGITDTVKKNMEELSTDTIAIKDYTDVRKKKFAPVENDLKVVEGKLEEFLSDINSEAYDKAVLMYDGRYKDIFGLTADDLKYRYPWKNKKVYVVNSITGNKEWIWADVLIIDYLGTVEDFQPEPQRKMLVSVNRNTGGIADEYVNEINDNVNLKYSGKDLSISCNVYCVFKQNNILLYMNVKNTGKDKINVKKISNTLGRGEYINTPFSELDIEPGDSNRVIVALPGKDIPEALLIDDIKCKMQQGLS